MYHHSNRVRSGRSSRALKSSKLVNASSDKLVGKVHNPSGQGVAAFSSKKKTTNTDKSSSTNHQPQKQNDHETRKIEEGSARRNITRKKTDSSTTGHYDSRNKKHGGAGKGKWLPGKHSDHLTLLDEDLPLDENDPLYVAEEDADPSSY
eukprot:scaffold13458_cov132-Skeletonema_dohrnii-CCMP3373.AAC.1